MARIEGVLLPNNKRVEIGLTYLYGVGLHRSQAILNETGISPDVRMKDLSHEQVAKIQGVFPTLTKLRELRKEVTLNIKRLQEIGSYRGSRHKRALPVRGQRTKTNARTRKGPRRAGGAITLKKSVPKK